MTISDVSGLERRAAKPKRPAGRLSPSSLDTAVVARTGPHGPARANRRNNPQTGNHAFKTIFGDEIYNKNATEQCNEILGMTLAYSLTRLIHLEVDRGIQAVFAPGARILASARWLVLDELRSTIPSRSRVKPELT